jgi:hypothetical protein
MRTRKFLAAVVLFGVSSGIVLAQTPNPLVGKWTLNAAKSKGPATAGVTIVEAVGDGIKMTVELVGADGKKMNWAFTGNYDGKDVPVTGDSPYGDTVSLTRVDARTTRISAKYQGKPTTTHMIVVSADGKSRTSTVKGTDKTGKPLDAMSFYEKQ